MDDAEHAAPEPSASYGGSLGLCSETILVESPSKDCYCDSLVIPDRQPESFEEELLLMKCSNCIASSQPMDDVETEIVDLEALAHTMISETPELEPVNDSIIAQPAESEEEVVKDTPTRKLRRLGPLFEEPVMVNSPLEEPIEEPFNQFQLQECDVCDVSWFVICLLGFGLYIVYIYIYRCRMSILPQYSSTRLD